MGVIEKNYNNLINMINVTCFKQSCRAIWNRIRLRWLLLLGYVLVDQNLLKLLRLQHKQLSLLRSESEKKNMAVSEARARQNCGAKRARHGLYFAEWDNRRDVAEKN